MYKRNINTFLITRELAMSCLAEFNNLFYREMFAGGFHRIAKVVFTKKKTYQFLSFPRGLKLNSFDDRAI